MISHDFQREIADHPARAARRVTQKRSAPGWVEATHDGRASRREPKLNRAPGAPAMSYRTESRSPNGAFNAAVTNLQALRGRVSALLDNDVPRFRRLWDYYRNPTTP